MQGIMADYSTRWTHKKAISAVRWISALLATEYIQSVQTIIASAFLHWHAEFIDYADCYTPWSIKMRHFILHYNFRVVSPHSLVGHASCTRSGARQCCKQTYLRGVSVTVDMQPQLQL